MARTQAEDYEEKREAIRARAADLFAEKGFAAASTADIARACGVSKSLIYHYYNSKEDILFDLMAAHVGELLETARAPGPDDPIAAFRALTQRLLGAYVGASSKQKVLLDELKSLPPERRREIVDAQRAIIREVEAALVRARPRAGDEPGLLRVRTMLYFGMLNWTRTWFDADGEVSRETLAGMASDFILGSV